MAMQLPNILVLVVISVLCVAVNFNALELATNLDLDWDKEFRAVGVASLIAGLGGGLPGCVDASSSALGRRIGANTRLTGTIVALVIGLALFLGDTVLALLPVPVMGGILIFISVGLLDEWLIRTHKRLPWADYAIVLLIFAIIVFLGFLEGLAIGIAITIVIFTIRLSRVELIVAECTGRQRQSNRSRPIADRAILLANGEQVRAHWLRGYIFFGSAYSLMDRLKQLLGGGSPPACILLDFSAVSGLDFSAVNTLCGFVRNAHDAGTTVVLSEAPENCKDGLERNLPSSVHASLRFEPDEDRALERCEDLILAARRSEFDQEESSSDTLLDRFAEDMESRLDRRILFEDIAHEFRDRLEVCEYEAGEALVAMGASPGGLQLILMGRASVYDAAGKRLHQCGPGDAIEPRQAFGTRAATAAAIADEPCRTLKMTPETRRWLEENRGQLMLRLYGYLLTAEADAESLPGPDARQKPPLGPQG